MSNPLLEIARLGQSVWYDNIGRDLLRSGELEKMIREDGVTGVTSNPTIFEKAITGSRTYDSQIHQLVDEGLTLTGIYEGLAIRDIQDAADLLLPVYERTSGREGYVSLEVSPDLAYDAAGTVEEARRLFGVVGRKNLLVKVPATPQGMPAITELIGVGVNVNATLIFSLEQYRRAAEAFIAGMERWVASGGDPAAVSSVASFFVSRVDTLVDERLEELAHPAIRPAAMELKGKAAIANARIAYSIYKELFHGSAFSELSARGAAAQRIVWASTSSKNPQYPDTYYVDALIGAETVNTIPHATLEAFRLRGRAASRLEENLEQARAVFAELEKMGLNTGQVMEELLDDGVKAFADSFNKLLAAIGEKRTRLLRGWGHRSASMGEFQRQVDDVLQTCDKEKIAAKIWACDPTLWKDDPKQRAEISQRLGWLTVVETMIGETHKIKSFADEIRSAGFRCAVLLGMGGSSLASEVFRECFGVAAGYLDLKALDTTVPASILEAQRGLDLKTTLFIVSSKSGGTIEVSSLYKYFRSLMEQVAGDRAGEHFVAITDPGTSLGKMASEHRFRKTFLNPPDVGGRFSALSYFGLAPAALMGVDIDRLLMRAAQAVESSGLNVPAIENAALWLGAIMGRAADSGMDKISLIISPKLASFSLWIEQLVAESTGKEGKGVIPIADEPPGAPEKYGADRVFVYLRLDEDNTYDEFVSAMEKAKHPVITLRVHGPFDLGREMFRWEFATAVAGAVLKINPFDQPNVQESKDLTGHLLDLYRQQGFLPEGERLSVDDPSAAADLSAFLGQAGPGDYVGLNCYLHPSRETVQVLQSIRGLIQDRLAVATTLGFGPRFLHSTGQIHKGGPNKGVFLQITSEDAEDIDVPGEPYSFGVLKTAQSLGDYQALKKRGRRILRVHLSSPADLDALFNIIRSSL